MSVECPLRNVYCHAPSGSRNAAGNLDEAKADYQKVSSALDKAAKRGIIHKNSADRRKSTLNRAIAPAKS